MNKIILTLITAYSAASYCSDPNPRGGIRFRRDDMSEREKDDLRSAFLVSFDPHKESLGLYEKKPTLGETAARYFASRGGLACSKCLIVFSPGEPSFRGSDASSKAAYCKNCTVTNE